MTYNQLFAGFKKKYGDSHDFIFFELLFFCSSEIKSKIDFISLHNKQIIFKEKIFWKLCKQYFNNGKPLAHIVRSTKFCNLDFYIHNKVLCPRDITEQMTWDFINSHKNIGSSQVWDLCCGSGCIGIAIKKHLPQISLTCVDKYWRTIFNTRENAKKHKIALTIDYRDVVNFLNKKDKAEYIISNPPYINKNNFKNIKMFKYENKKALIGKENGLYFYKKYFEWLNNHVFKEAWLEIGYDIKGKLLKEAKKHSNIHVFSVPDKSYIVIKNK